MKTQNKNKNTMPADHPVDENQLDDSEVENKTEDNENADDESSDLDADIMMYMINI